LPASGAQATVEGSTERPTSAPDASIAEPDTSHSVPTPYAVDGTPIESASLQNAETDPEEAAKSGIPGEEAADTSSEGIRAIEMPDSPPSDAGSGRESSPRHKFVASVDAGPIAESTEHDSPALDMDTEAHIPDDPATENGVATGVTAGNAPLPDADQPTEGLEGCVVDNYVTVRAYPV